MEKKYESRMAGDRWWPINKSTTVDGRLVAWMEENGATYVKADVSGGILEVRELIDKEAAEFMLGHDDGGPTYREIGARRKAMLK